MCCKELSDELKISLVVKISQTLWFSFPFPRRVGIILNLHIKQRVMHFTWGELV